MLAFKFKAFSLVDLSNIYGYQADGAAAQNAGLL